MSKQTMLRLSLPLLALSICGVGHAHPGGLDSRGCHTNRKTGEYHCHRAQGSSSSDSSAPRSSTPSSPSSSSYTSPPATDSPRPSYLVAQPEAPPAPVPAPAISVRPATTPADDPDLVKAAQLLLPSIGYDAGAATGQAHDLTLAAVKRFQERHGLPANGRVTAALVATIAKDVLDVSRARHQRIVQLEAATSTTAPVPIP